VGEATSLPSGNARSSRLNLMRDGNPITKTQAAAPRSGWQPPSPGPLIPGKTYFVPSEMKINSASFHRSGSRRCLVRVGSVPLSTVGCRDNEDILDDWGWVPSPHRCRYTLCLNAATRRLVAPAGPGLLPWSGTHWSAVSVAPFEMKDALELGGGDETRAEFEERVPVNTRTYMPAPHQADRPHQRHDGHREPGSTRTRAFLAHAESIMGLLYPL
jgi:hypothetical protein